MNKTLCIVLCGLAAARLNVSLARSTDELTAINDGWTADGVPVTLPHCWNIEDGTDGPTDAIWRAPVALGSMLPEYFILRRK